MGKGETARDKQFLLFPVFSMLSKTKIIILVTLHLSSAAAFNSVKAYCPRSREIVRESHINEIKHIQNDKPLREFMQKNHKKKKTSGQIDEVEQFVQSDVRKMNIR